MDEVRQPGLRGKDPHHACFASSRAPPYLHDGRLLTLEDTIEFFDLVLQTRLLAAEKAELLAFLQTL